MNYYLCKQNLRTYGSVHFLELSKGKSGAAHIIAIVRIIGTFPPSSDAERKVTEFDKFLHEEKKRTEVTEK